MEVTDLVDYRSLESADIQATVHLNVRTDQTALKRQKLLKSSISGCTGGQFPRSIEHDGLKLRIRYHRTSFEGDTGPEDEESGVDQKNDQKSTDKEAPEDMGAILCEVSFSIEAMKEAHGTPISTFDWFFTPTTKKTVLNTVHYNYM